MRNVREKVRRSRLLTMCQRHSSLDKSGATDSYLATLYALLRLFAETIARTFQAPSPWPARLFVLALAKQSKTFCFAMVLWPVKTKSVRFGLAKTKTNNRAGQPSPSQRRIALTWVLSRLQKWRKVGAKVNRKYSSEHDRQRRLSPFIPSALDKITTSLVLTSQQCRFATPWSHVHSFRHAPPRSLAAMQTKMSVALWSERIVRGSLAFVGCILSRNAFCGVQFNSYDYLRKMFIEHIVQYAREKCCKQVQTWRENNRHGVE